MKILVINGPNLNMLGVREPGVYGSQSFTSYLEELKSEFCDDDISYFQSNCEGELIDALHKSHFDNIDGVVLNAGAYTHTSIALADAIGSIKTPVIEVHISNTAAREEFRHKSYIGAKCVGTIAGFGLNSYNLAISAIKKLNR
ncbi:MAG: type II 3-dehydroquinate dehydratase [Rikenellaceae bacterium]